MVFFVLGSVVLVGAAVMGIKLYRNANKVISRADRTASRVEAMVSSVDSAVTSVKKTATAVDLGVRAGSFARTAANTVFKKGGDSGAGNGKGPARDGKTEATSKS